MFPVAVGIPAFSIQHSVLTNLAYIIIGNRHTHTHSRGEEDEKDENKKRVN